jgi:hypothetical protein
MKLTYALTNRVIDALPKSIVRFLQSSGRGVVLAGGFIRAVEAGEKPKDIDLFLSGGKFEALLPELVSELLREEGPTFDILRTSNSVSIKRAGGITVQLIQRWVYARPEDVTPSFDYTIAQACIWYDLTMRAFDSDCADSFIQDVADKRLVYTSPVRDEAKAGSFLRMVKFLKMGYAIDRKNLAEVTARATGNTVEDVTASFIEAVRPQQPDPAFLTPDQEQEALSVEVQLVPGFPPLRMPTTPHVFRESS